ncbi:hypothetical protein ES703_30634 [subsurface metagenome]
MAEKKSESVVREIKRKTLRMRREINLGNAECLS